MTNYSNEGVSVSEQLQPPASVPFGFESSRSLAERAVVDAATLPWLRGTVELGVTECRLQSRASFLMARDIGADLGP